MKNVVAALVGVCLVNATAYAASDSVEAAKVTFTQVATDPDKLATYCALMVAAESIGGDDSAENEPFQKAFAENMTKLGPDFEAAWNAGNGLEYDTPDEKVYREASEALQAHCPSKVE